MYVTIEVLLETVFSTRFMQRGDKEDKFCMGGCEEKEKLEESWKRAAIQRGLGSETSRISTIRSHYQ
jgi:hypothetical protein